VRCNRASVEVEPITDSSDADLIQLLTARHAELTGSPRAKWILDHFETMLPKFIKVFPHEYKRVLGVSRAAAAQTAAHAHATRQSAQEVLHG
jgi:glutamate synthase domain-containing protein 3